MLMVHKFAKRLDDVMTYATANSDGRLERRLTRCDLYDCPPEVISCQTASHDGAAGPDLVAGTRMSMHNRNSES